MCSASFDGESMLDSDLGRSSNVRQSVFYRAADHPFAPELPSPSKKRPCVPPNPSEVGPEFCPAQGRTGEESHDLVRGVCPPARTHFS